MTHDDSERQATTRTGSDRDYEIERITAQYVDDYRRAGMSPLDDYLHRYPHYAREISEFALYFHVLAEDLPEPDVLPAQELSPAARAARERIRKDIESSLAASIEGLVQRGIAVGYPAPQLAAAVGISVDVLAKLQAKAIAAATVPFTLVERLAAALKATPQAVAAFMVGTAPTQAGAFYYAEQAPEQRQESFLEAIQATSALDERAKHEWTNIVARDLPPS